MPRRPAARISDAASSSFAQISRGHHHARARLRQRERARAPDAPAGSRNKCCLVCHTIDHIIAILCAYDDLRDFVRALEKRGELKRIPFEVDPHLEITEFADRSVKTAAPRCCLKSPRVRTFRC